MNLNFATLWENISDLIPDTNALICRDEVYTWRDYEKQSAIVASALSKAGLKEHSTAGIYLHNSNEYLIAQFSIFKVGGVSINVNYRYQADELIYLIDNADCEAIFYQACYGEQINKIKDHLPKVKAWIEVADGSESIVKHALHYEELIERYDPMERFERSEDILYMLYTGGTTGMPKGVMYKQSEFIVAMFRTLKGLGFDVPENLDDLNDYILKVNQSGETPVSLVGCPLMHGTGMWLGCFLPHNLGGTVVTMPELGFNPHNLWEECLRSKATSITIVGDAFARPMLDALNDAKDRNQPYDLRYLKTIISSGVMWSSEVKMGILEHADIVLMDTMGSTEGGMGSSITTRDAKTQTAKFRLNPGTIVLGDDGELVEPGSNKMGMIGTAGLVPIGYYKDEEKSKATFKEYQGVRYSFPGDYAKVEVDGTITLLGRGSNCINSAGEKIYPEEVEEALKKNHEVFDCLVVGVEDKKFGQKVVAVISISSTDKVSEDELINKTREHLSGYKLPKKIIFVDEVKRAPNGKANYKWAKEVADEACD